MIQRAFYGGFKKHHGVKYQSLEAPNGMCIHMFGPMSERHNDLEMVTISDINAKLAAAQAHLPDDQQKVSYGDGIFEVDTHIFFFSSTSCSIFSISLS